MTHAHRTPSITYLPLVAALLLIGCAGTIKNMQLVPPDRVVRAPEAGKSMIVFLRPSGMAFGVQSSVFDVKEGKPKLIGIVAAQKKVAYQAEAGEHLFMVVGESADFMSAELAAGKTYYALVTPRMGAWKARFSLAPVHAEELDSAQFKEWLEKCEWVEMNAESAVWESSNMADIQSKHDEYYQKWMGKDSSARPRLLPQDGR